MPTRLTSTVVLAILLVLPGCLTGALWRDYSWPEATTSTVPVGTSEVALVGEIRASAPTVTNGLWWRGPTGDWFLAARDGAGAEVAAAICDEPEFASFLHASIHADRHVVSDEVDHDLARLELTMHLDRSGIAEAVPDDAIDDALLRHLQPQPRNAFFDDRGGDLPLPDTLRSCARRLPGVDIRWLAGTSGPAHVAAWVFVGADGRSLPSPDDLRPAMELGDGASLAERLACLRRVSLLVRVEHGDGSTLVRVRPDRLWLLAGFDRTDQGFVHRSVWRLQRRPEPGATAPAADAPPCSAHLWLRESHWQRWYHPVWLDPDLVTRIVLTPIALAADIALGPGAGDLLAWLTGSRSDRPGRDRNR